MLNATVLKSMLLAIACVVLPQTLSASPQTSGGDAAQTLELQTANQQPFQVYVAGPKDAKQAILLIHGWWGLDQDVKTWANEYAVAGFRVMAVDLYNHQVTHNPATAKQLMQSVRQSDADEIYATAIKALSAPGRKIAIMGRSYGANQALHAAQVGRDKVAATIVYYPYGELITDRKMLNEIKTPILGHFASRDFFLPTDKVQEFASAVKKAGLPVTVNMYDARHGFDKFTSSNFNEPAHNTSQQRTHQFLKQNLF